LLEYLGGGALGSIGGEEGVGSIGFKSGGEMGGRSLFFVICLIKSNVILSDNKADNISLSSV